MVRWQSRERSDNVEDRRRRGPARAALGGGGGILLLIIVFVVSGGDLGKVLQVAQQQAQQAPARAPNAGQAPDPAQDRLADFVSVMLKDTEVVWAEQFRKLGQQYEEPTLVLFSGSTESACGFASAASGPFYCPADRKVYIDLVFYEELETRFGAPGDFAQAYVVAHEVGHHVQNLMGLTSKIHSQQQQVSKVEANDLSVRLELQADFLAGVWAHHADEKYDILERGDIAEGLNAAAMIGDDTLQKKSQGYVVEESFTHGSAEQRMRWFKLGLETGDLSRMMETFSRSDP